MNQYHTECLALGSLLRFPKAIHYAKARLDLNSFIFDANGKFGTEHNALWLLIQKNAFGGVFNNISDPEYAKSLIDRLAMQYHVYDFDEQSFRETIDAIYNHSTMYRQMQLLSKHAEHISNPKTFGKFYEERPDALEWSASVVGLITKSTSSAASGFQFDSASDVRDLWKEVESGLYRPYVQTGVEILEKSAFPAREGITIVHGVSSSGKTALSVQIALAHACYLYANDIPGCVAIASLEMPARTLKQRMIASLARVSYQKRLMGLTTALENDCLNQWSYFYDLLPIGIDDASNLTTNILSYTTTGLNVSDKGPIRLMVTDYGELFADKDDSTEQRVSNIFRNQRAIAKTLGIPFLAISQSTYEKGSFIAGPDGTRYSKAILHAADQVAEVWNPVMLAKTRELPKNLGFDVTHPWLLMQKNRDGAIADPMPLGWIPACNFFYDFNLNNIPGQEIFSRWFEPAVKKSGLNLKPMLPQAHTPTTGPIML